MGSIRANTCNYYLKNNPVLRDSEHLQYIMEHKGYSLTELQEVDLEVLMWKNDCSVLRDDIIIAVDSKKTWTINHVEPYPFYVHMTFFTHRNISGPDQVHLNKTGSWSLVWP